MPLEVPIQPDSDLPAPPPGPQARRSWWIVGLMFALVVASVILLALKIRQNRREAERQTVFSRFSSVSYGLFKFDTKYGSFPSDDTQADVCDTTGHAPWPSVTSNDLLRQLIVSGTYRSEFNFSDMGLAGWARMPDGVVSPIHKALEPGECAVAYVPGASATGDPSRPILLYPVVPGSLRFDPKPLGGKAIILRIDGSMAAIEVDRHGRAIVNGKDYFDPSQPIWGGMPPDVRLPAWCPTD